MPYEDTCPDCHGNGKFCGYMKGPCVKCDGTGKVKPFRVAVPKYEAKKHGWTTLLTWPKYGPLGFCQCCGKVLTGRQQYYCGSRKCEVGIYKRLYKGCHWTKRHMIAKHGPICAICGHVYESRIMPNGPIYPEPHRLTVDHILPLADGGTEEESNLQLLCPKPCHAAKTAKENAKRRAKKAK